MSKTLSLEKFDGKVAVVTGASAGIGKAISEALVKNGVLVAGIGRRSELIEQHAAQLEGEKGKLHAFKCDLNDQREILATFDKIDAQLGPISILINNAAILNKTNIIDGQIDQWKRVLDVNVLALSICIKMAIENMKSHKTKGHIVNLNAVLGHSIVDIPNFNVYTASKYAVTALTETVRLEINREKLPIKITSLSPGYVKTDFTLTLGDGAHADSPGLVVEDVADAALYVLSTPDHVNVKELTLSVQGLWG